MPDQFDLPGFGAPPEPGPAPRSRGTAQTLPAPAGMAKNHLFVALFLPAGPLRHPACQGEEFQRFSALGELLRAERGLRGKLLDPQRLHVTLLDLGSWAELPADLVGAVSGALDRFSAPPFDLVFDRALSFSGSPQRRPYVLCGGEGLADLVAFRQRLAQAVQGAGVRVARSFTPHMTLLYSPDAVAEHPIDPVHWTARDLSLVFGVNREGRRVHQILGRWPLQA